MPLEDPTPGDYYLVVATKNTKDRSGTTYMTDLDINSLKFYAMQESALPSKE